MSEKLNSGTFKDIEYNETKELLKENNSVSEVKEFIRDNIHESILNLNLDNINNEKFLEFLNNQVMFYKISKIYILILKN